MFHPTVQGEPGCRCPPTDHRDLWELLQYHVTTYLDNEVAGCPGPAPQRPPLKTLSQRLKGKDGRFRGSLSGKRVNFSSRPRSSPRDPNLSVSQVGVPRAVANEMTIPVRVTSYNIEDAYPRITIELIPFVCKIIKGEPHPCEHAEIGGLTFVTSGQQCQPPRMGSSRYTGAS